MTELCEEIRRRNRSLPVPVCEDAVFVVRALETGESAVRGVRAEQARARRLQQPEGAVTSRAAEAFRQRSLKAGVASRTHEVGRLDRSLAESRQMAGGTRRKWQFKIIKASSYIAQYPIFRIAQSPSQFTHWQTCSNEQHLDFSGKTICTQMISTTVYCDVLVHAAG